MSRKTEDMIFFCRDAVFTVISRKPLNNACKKVQFYYCSQRFHVNFNVKKVFVCQLLIGLYFSNSKLDDFFFALKHKYPARRTFAPLE